MIRYLILLSLFSVGIWAIVFSLSPLEKQKESQSWNSTVAVVRSSEVQQFERKEKQATDSRIKTKISYRPEVVFSYSIAGHEYTGKRLNFSHRSYRDLEVAQDIQETYVPGQEIEIFYNPANPSESVIIRDGEAIIPLTYFGALLAGQLGVSLDP